VINEYGIYGFYFSTINGEVLNLLPPVCE